MLDKLKDQLIIHEGLRLFPYECTSGKTTIGIGRNLEDIGITEEEAHILLETDIKRVQRQLDKLWPHWRMMVEPRQAALINFVFNVGIVTAEKFKNAMEALKQSDYDTAAREFLDSRWAKQVGKRAEQVTEQIRTGEWQ